MDPIQDYQNALNTPLTSGTSSPTTVVTPKLATKAINQVKQGVLAVNTAMSLHRANSMQQEQVKKQEDYVKQQDSQMNQQNQQQMAQKAQQDQMKMYNDQQAQAQKATQDEATNKLKELDLILKSLKENNGV